MADGGSGLPAHSRYGAREALVRGGKQIGGGGDLVCGAHRRQGSSGWPESGSQRAAFCILVVLCSVPATTWQGVEGAREPGRAAPGGGSRGSAGAPAAGGAGRLGLATTRRAAALRETDGQGRAAHIGIGGSEQGTQGRQRLRFGSVEMRGRAARDEAIRRRRQGSLTLYTF